jgi:CRISPR-associated protein Cmr2
MKAVTDRSGTGEKAIVFPDVSKLPLWLWEEAGRPKPARLDVLEPCIPNRFLAEVPAERGPELAKAAKDECVNTWREIAERVRAALYERHSHRTYERDDTRNNLWHLQIDTFFEVYTAVLPQHEYGPDRLTKLGKASGNEWADHHQLAQKMLLAVKNRRHFPVYAPTIDHGEVPQKDTLLGTLEHVGPGKLGAVAEFWQTVADKWHSRGSKVTRGERFCAVSLVKRFAWAHHFATKEMFKRDVRDLQFSDSATVAAAKWLADPKAPDPRKFVRPERDELWSGQWLHWLDKTPPNDDIDEDNIPDDVFGAIREKKAKQNKPPTYYCVFMFDGDRMGDRFNAAKNADAYQKISRTLGQFALDRVQGIDPIVKKHHGEQIYAGGDDAICVLPTESALACAGEINTEFHRNWDSGVESIKDQFPKDLQKATISGGLVVAHYKEDLRFVLEEARKAEKRAKDAGRDALAITVCRRSGEHTSAVVPWEFLPTVQKCVERFLPSEKAPGASDRWVYKLRADLKVLASDRDMFLLELGRQLGRAEDHTKSLFSSAPSEPKRAPDEVRKEFNTFSRLFLDADRQKQRKTLAADKDAINDFVILLQTASFLARGRAA